jgi:Protein of unknown function (DUF2934)
MSSKPAVQKETAKKESVLTTKKAAPRVSAAKHRAAKSQEMPVASENSSEIIAAIAYGYWEARGRQGGDPLEDWMRAEDEYKRGEYKSKAASA